MRKPLTFLIALALIASVVTESTAETVTAYPWFKETAKTEFRELILPQADRPAEKLSRQAALEDLDYFRYLIENAYSGYEYQREFSQVDFAANFAKAEAVIRDCPDGDIPGAVFSQALMQSLEGVRDGHLSIPGERNLLTHRDFYYAELTVKKVGNRYIVDSSQVDGIKAGDEYQGGDVNLFRVWSSEGERYRVGTLSEEWIEDLPLAFAGQTRRVPVHSNAVQQNPQKFDIDHSLNDGISYIHIPNFIASRGKNNDEASRKAMLAETSRLIAKLGEGGSVIVDLRGNEGGYANFAAEIPAGIYGMPVRKLGLVKETISASRRSGTYRVTESFESDFVSLISPPISQARLHQGETLDPFIERFLNEQVARFRDDPFRCWALQSNGGAWPTIPEPAKKVVILIDRKTSSCGELVCKMRRNPGVTVIGENSAGILLFNTPLRYYLPHTRRLVTLPATTLLDSSFYGGEGTGVLPDYWVTDGEWAEAIQAALGAESLSVSPEFLPPQREGEIRNPGFELDWSGGLLGWTVADSGLENPNEALTRDGETVDEGKFSARIALTEPGRTVLTQEIPVTPGVEYAITARVRVTDVASKSGTSGFSIGLQGGKSASRAVSGTSTEWESIAVAGTSRTGRLILTLRLGSYGDPASGVVNVDSIAIARKDK